LPSRTRGKTVPESLYPQPPEELVRLADLWTADASDLILRAIWSGYERLRNDHRLLHALNDATDDLERGITQLLELAIREELTGLEPFDVQHGVPEGESRKDPPARPREYDIAFIHYGNIRIMWPLEAKVMPPERKLTEYTDTLAERYLTCEYAPFVASGCMAGYVLSGDAAQLFADIADVLGVPLLSLPKSSWKNHRISDHVRQVPAGRQYPARFRCHHLMMVLKPMD
jgi:hypothetical protein